MLHIHLFLRIQKIFLHDFFYVFFNLLEFVCFLDILLLLISIFIALWSHKIHDIINFSVWGFFWYVSQYVVYFRKTSTGC